MYLYIDHEQLVANPPVVASWMGTIKIKETSRRQDSYTMKGTAIADLTP